MLDIVSVLPALLKTLDRPGDYYGAGRIELPVVDISVEGVGRIGLPIPALQAAELARVATPAPYGRGPDTLVDAAVRRCGQVGAAQVSARDPRWLRTLSIIVQRAVAELGVEGEVRAELYKLLVYAPGDFFLEHRDTEKAPGMFATLVVVLPSEHEGGELVVRHDGREVVLDLSDDPLGDARWAAFYTDCQHELRPVRSGWRVALAFNLIRSDVRPVPVPDHRPEVARVAEALRRWAVELDAIDSEVASGEDEEDYQDEEDEEEDEEGDLPSKLVYPLAHRYSLAELSFASLKNQDAAVAHVLIAAAAEAKCVLRLAMISIEEEGAADPSWSGRWGRGEPDGYEVHEVYERRQTLDSWRRPDDTVEALGPIPWADEEVSPPDALEDEEPDEENFHEATGNEGGSFDRVYRRAALVLWPAARELQLLLRNRPAAATGLLERFLDDPAEGANAAEVALHLVEHPSLSAANGANGNPRPRIVRALARLPDRAMLRRYLVEVVGAGRFEWSDVESVAQARLLLDSDDVVRVLTEIATACTAQRFAPVAKLFRLVAKGRPGSYLAGPFEVVASGMQALRSQWEWSEDGSELKHRPAGLVDLLVAVGASGDPSVGAKVAAAVVQKPALWDVDAVVVPALLARPPGAGSAFEAVMAPLRHASLVHLRARIALPLAAPADAARSADRLTCSCGPCADLRAFLVHPVERVWTLKAAKPTRAHVESVIRAAGSDLDLHTETRGSPHSLVCRKNQASYEARVRQRAADLAAVQEIEGTGEWTEVHA